MRSMRSRSSISLTLGPRPNALRSPELALTFWRSPLERAVMRSSALGRSELPVRGAGVRSYVLGLVARSAAAAATSGSTAGRAAYACCAAVWSVVAERRPGATSPRAPSEVVPAGVEPEYGSRPWPARRSRRRRRLRRASAGRAEPVCACSSRPTASRSASSVERRRPGAAGRGRRPGRAQSARRRLRLAGLARLPRGVLPRRAPRVGRGLLGLAARRRRRRDGESEAARDGVVRREAGDALALGASGLVLAHRALLAGLTTCAVPASGPV